MKTISKDQKLIRKTRRKIISMTTGIVAVLFIGLEIGYSSYLIINENNQINNQLNQMILKSNEDDSSVGENTGFGKGDFDHQRGFVIKVDSSKTVTYKLGTEVYSDFVTTNLDYLYSNTSGNVGYIYFKSADYSSYKLIAGCDRSIEQTSIRNTILTSSFALLGGTLLVFLISFWLSRMILKPIQEAQKSQKEFISNASHELKTPLTIIDANASILKNGSEDNKWVNNILNETKNMNGLILDMISLASVEEKESIIDNFDLTDAINNVALAFDAVCFEDNIEYVTNIQDEITIKGNKKDVEKITKILIDNAVKYVTAKGIINVTLLKDKTGTYLSVYNSGCTLKDGERDKIFNRFYRDEISRDGEAKQGSGLGLAILKEICNKYNYSITVDSKENTFFKITIKF